MAATISVPILPDWAAEGTETFSVVLRNPVGAVLGTPKAARVQIRDDDLVR
jgi:hypothetical protein